jgi:hypothetical protein
LGEGGKGGVAHPAKNKAMPAARRTPCGLDLKRDKAKMFIPVLEKSDGSCEHILAVNAKTRNVPQKCWHVTWVLLNKVSDCDSR